MEPPGIWPLLTVRVYWIRTSKIGHFRTMCHHKLSLWAKLTLVCTLKTQIISIIKRFTTSDVESECPWGLMTFLVLIYAISTSIGVRSKDRNTDVLYQQCIANYYHNDCALLLLFSVSAITITATENSAFQLDFFAFAPTTTAFQASTTN